MKDNFKSKFALNPKNTAIISALLLLCCFLLSLVINAYNTYRDTIIIQQEQFLLTISDNAARSITTYLDNKESELVFLSESIDGSNYTELISDYCDSANNAVNLMALFDENGEFIYENQSSQPIISSAEIRSLEMSQTSRGNNISRAFESRGGCFVLIYSRQVKTGDMNGCTIYVALSVEELYKQIIEPINTGVKGYTMVKNSKGVIIMHPFPQQIGLDVIDGRKELFPKLDYADLERLIELQLTGERGYMMYTSYWWTDEIPTPVVKLNGYCPVTVGDEFWIIATTIDYHELDLPVSKTRNNLFLFGLIVIGLLLFIIIVIYKNQRDHQYLTDKMSHLQELNEALEDLQKSQHQLSHLQKMETIGTFTSGIAHEINNLLTPILGYSEIILSDTLPDTRLYGDISEIHNASIKAKDVINQLLIYSRRQKNSGLKYIQINDLLNQSIKLLNSFLPSNIELVTEIEENAGFIYANETQISQVILNLCTNSIQAMEDGGELTIMLAVKNMELSETGGPSSVSGSVKISVKDTGTGIDEKIMGDIFTPFFTTKDIEKGTGLGLSIVQGIVLSHHGEIKAQSKKGCGSLFSILLPRYESYISESIASAASEPGKKGLSILFIDDAKEVGRMVKRKLSGDGNNVDVYYDSLQVMDLFNRENCKYDLVITDYSMPKIDGIKLSRIIKKRKPQIKIILVSGFIDEEFEKYFAENLFDAYLAKPFTISELKSTIDGLF